MDHKGQLKKWNADSNGVYQENRLLQLTSDGAYVAHFAIGDVNNDGNQDLYLSRRSGIQGQKSYDVPDEIRLGPVWDTDPIIVNSFSSPSDKVLYKDGAFYVSSGGHGWKGSIFKVTFE